MTKALTCIRDEDLDTDTDNETDDYTDTGSLDDSVGRYYDKQLRKELRLISASEYGAVEGKAVSISKGQRIERDLAKLAAETDELERLVEDGQNESAITSFRKAALRRLITMLPEAERVYRKNPNMSNAYAFNSLISQAREIIADIQSEDDSRELMNRVLNDVLRPAFFDLANNAVNTFSLMREGIGGDIPRKEFERVVTHVNGALKSIAHYYEARYQKLVEQVSAAFTESE